MRIVIKNASNLSLISVMCSCSQLELEASMTWLKALLFTLYVTNMWNMNAYSVPIKSRPLKNTTRLHTILHHCLPAKLGMPWEALIAWLSNDSFKGIFMSLNLARGDSWKLESEGESHIMQRRDQSASVWVIQNERPVTNWNTRIRLICHPRPKMLSTCTNKLGVLTHLVVGQIISSAYWKEW